MKKLLSVVLFLLATSTAFAQNSEPEKVKIFVDDLGNKIVAIANEKSTSEAKKKEKIIATIDNVIDSDWIARFVLGKSYKTIDEEQKARFTKLYRDFMINTYGPKFKNYNGRKFSVNSVEEQNGFYIAKSEFLPRDSNAPISVLFRVKNRDGKLVILDFIAEGISLIETQRSEFNSAISQKGIEQFLKDFAKRVGDLKSGK